jgi:tRNA threonylcarbamoyladenosine biosynthesis protein TsaB
MREGWKYSAMFTPNLENLRETLAEVITEHSFENFDEKLYFVGDCADKCKSTLSKENFIFLEDIKYPSADQMSVLSYEKFKMSDTVDVAYFEPYYLKDFMTTAKK